MNELNDAVKAAESALPDSLTWLDAFRSHKDATIELWKISGKVGVGDLMNKTDRIRLADKIVKHQATGDTPMPKQTEAGDAMSLADNTDREYILAAAKHRRQLQQSDTESIFDIAARLRMQVEAARAADAARRRPEATFDAAGHRPGWRLTDDAWRHDRRRKQSTTHEFDPAGREANTYVTTEEDDEEDGKRNGKTEEAISDCYKQYQDELCNAWHMKK